MAEDKNNRVSRSELLPPKKPLIYHIVLILVVAVVVAILLFVLLTADGNSEGAIESYQRLLMDTDVEL